MKAEQVINSRLSSFSGVSSLVDTRIYPVALPQEAAYPCILYKRIESRRVEGVYSDPGYVYATIAVQCFSKTYDKLKELAEQVRLALERYGTAVTGTPIAGVTVYDIKIGAEADSYEPTLDVYVQSTDFIVLHAE